MITAKEARELTKYNMILNHLDKSIRIAAKSGDNKIYISNPNSNWEMPSIVKEELENLGYKVSNHGVYGTVGIKISW